MSTREWRAVEFAARFLAPDEREAVLGDLVESGESARSGLVQVIGLVARREGEGLTQWSPWVAALGVVVPSSFLLMGLSLSVCTSSQQFLGASGGVAAVTPMGLFLKAALLMLSSWSAGRAVALISKRTLWLSVLSSFGPCWFCCSRFHHASQSPTFLLIFLIPAALGGGYSLRRSRLGRTGSLVLALAITLLVLHPWAHAAGPGQPMRAWIFQLAELVGPAWYLAARSLRSREVSIS